MSMQDLATAARGAGFTGNGLVTAIAVGMAESGGNLLANHRNADYQASVDRGPWEINSYWHSEVSDACCYDWACSAQAAYRISNGGSDWSQWATFKGGQYLQYMPQAAAITTGVVPVAIPGIVPAAGGGAAMGVMPGFDFSQIIPSDGSFPWIPVAGVIVLLAIL